MHAMEYYVMCVPKADKFGEVVVNAYLREIYCRFEGSRNTLSIGVYPKHNFC